MDGQGGPRTEATDGWTEGRGYRKRVLFGEGELRCDGALVQMVEIPPKTTVPPHYHRSSVEVFHILEGSGTMRIGDAIHHLSPGDTVSCQPPSVHDARNESDRVWRYIVFKTNVLPDDIYWVDDRG